MSADILKVTVGFWKFMGIGWSSRDLRVTSEDEGPHGIFSMKDIVLTTPHFPDRKVYTRDKSHSATASPAFFWGGDNYFLLICM